MQKTWNILPSAPQDFFDKYPNYDRVVLQLLYNRGITEKNDIENFLNPTLEKIYDPFVLKDMTQSVEKMIDHIKKGNKILIYGDYDADGITSSSLLFSLLHKLKADVSVYIPDRVTEGYGLNKEAIDKFAEREVDLIITVDTGIRNREEVEYVSGKGMEIIVTDHHIPAEEDLPDCLIINPHLDREEYGCEFLAGVGVAFKLAQALIIRSTLADKDKDTLIKMCLDLVAVGTVADCVPLLDENRILVKQGLSTLNQTGRAGLLALIEVAGLSKNNGKLQAWNIGFQIAPRLNASGRIGEVADAVDLLLAEQEQEANDIAVKLDQENAKRQEITEEMVYSIEERIEAGEIGQGNIIVAVNPADGEWNEGVIGLAAGRICERYYKPTLVITRTNGEYKGSGRSVDEFNVIEAVSECADVLDKYGGHAKACGFSLSPANLESFSEKINKIAEEKLKGAELRPKLEIDAELDINEVDGDLVEKVEALSPFGEGNSLPVFVSREVCIKNIVTMGNDGRHIKFRFNGYWALAFGKAEAWSGFRIGDRVDIVYSVEFNNFNGNTQVQLKLWDVVKASGQG
jgi:single-stranded-DNA-specific exonuclease